MPAMTRLEASTRKTRRRNPEQRQRPKNQPRGMSKGAAAAQRASAGIGTTDLEPTDWLFGDMLKPGS